MIAGQMGCITSQLEPSDVVKHCKDRKVLVKAAVKYRQELSRAHSAYMDTLKTVGITMKRFVEDTSSDSQLSSPRTPTTTVFSVPRASSPPPTPPPAVVPPSPKLTANSPVSPFRPPPHKEILLSPQKQKSPARSSPPFQVTSPRSDAEHTPPRYSSDMATTRRTSEFSPSFFSPTMDHQNDLFSTISGTSRFTRSRDDPDEFFSVFSHASRMRRSPPPSPSPPQNDSWFADFFSNLPMPYQLEEQRAMDRYAEVEHDEERQDLDRMRNEEGVPDLEEEELKEDEMAKSSAQKGATVSVTPVEEANAQEELDEPPALANTSKVEATVENVEKEATTSDAAKNIEDLPRQFVPLEERDLVDAVSHIHYQFIRASKSGKDISQLLDVKMIHQSVLQVSNVFNAYWVRKASNAMRDVYDNDEDEHARLQSHASTLETLYAWEKKLYMEVKEGEDIQEYIEYRHKQLCKLQAKGAAGEVLDIARANLKKLENQLQVALVSIHSVSDQIRNLTDVELFYHLLELAEGLADMWEVMLECHKIQYAVSLGIKNLENSAAGKEAIEAHKQATKRFGHELERWKKCFQQWIESQKNYIGTLFEWLRLCNVGPATYMDNSSEWMDQKNLMCVLLHRWQGHLQELMLHEGVVDTIGSFVTVIGALEHAQLLELNLKREADKSERELTRKTNYLQKMERKHGEELGFENDATSQASWINTKNTILLQRAEVNTSRHMVTEDKRIYFAAMEERKASTLSKLKENLPTVFDALVKFARHSEQEYKKMHVIMDYD